MYGSDKAHRAAMKNKRSGSKQGAKARMMAGTNKKSVKPSYPPR